MPRALRAVAGKSGVRHHLALPVDSARDISTRMSERRMDSFDLEPRYSTKEIPGKCLKCLAEQELNNCLRMLLIGEGEDKELQQQYEMLVSFLESPESRKLRDESEKYLAEGKKVTLRLSFAGGIPKYELEIS